VWKTQWPLWEIERRKRPRIQPQAIARQASSFAAFGTCAEAVARV
jgi:hypothetical protein